MNTFDKVILAIEKQEGFYVKGSRAHRNNNPGNLKYGTLAKSCGATGKDDERHAIFPTVAHGREALRKLFRIKFNGMSLAQIGTVYAEDKQWAGHVAHIAGVDLFQPIYFEGYGTEVANASSE